MITDSEDIDDIE